MPPELKVLLLSAVPLVEMKGGIPLGVALGLPIVKAGLLGILGTCLQIPFNLLLAEALTRLAHRNRHAHRFLTWSRERSTKHQSLVNGWGMVGVAVLVGIPIPGTGLWTGTMAGYALGLDRRALVTGLILGTIVAGALVCLATLGVWRLL